MLDYYHIIKKYTKLYFTDHTENVHKPLQICFICFHNHQKTKNWDKLLVFDELFRTKKKMFGYHYELMRSFCVLCLQVLNNLFLLFKEADSGLNII